MLVYLECIESGKYAIPVLVYLYWGGTVVGAVLMENLHGCNKMFRADPPAQLPASGTKGLPCAPYCDRPLPHTRQGGWRKGENSHELHELRPKQCHITDTEDNLLLK